MYCIRTLSKRGEHVSGRCFSRLVVTVPALVCYSQRKLATSPPATGNNEKRPASTSVHGLRMARSLCRIFNGFQNLCLFQFTKTRLSHQCTKVLFRTSFERTVVKALPSFFSPQPRDFSLPNSSWGEEMMRLYDFYNSQSELETEGEEEQREQWTRLPSYNRSLKYATGGVYLSKIIQSKARLFTRNIRQAGAAFEYVLFFTKDKQRCVCIFQAGHLLEGPPGHVHGGAIATMIDTVTGTHASLLCAPVMTANLNVNYRSPVPLGSTVLIESTLDKQEGRKIFISCKVTSTDGSKLHTEASALFVSISVSHLLRG